MGLQPLACWDCTFKSHRGKGYLSFVCFVCCHVEVSASGRSLVQRSPTECSVSECDREASTVRRRWPTRDCRAMKKEWISTYTWVMGFYNVDTPFSLRCRIWGQRNKDLKISPFARQVQETGYLALYEIETWNTIAELLREKHRKYDISTFTKQTQEVTHSRTDRRNNWQSEHSI
jgi:hypothetical protein